MSLNRDAIFQALSDQLTAALGASLKTSSRRYLEYDEVPADQQPALLVIGIGDRLERSAPELPPRHHLRALVVLYVRDDTHSGSDPATTPETTVLQLVGQVEDALRPTAQDRTQTGPFSMLVQAPTTTLGGRVQHAWVQDILLHQGAGAGQAGATLMVDLLVVDPTEGG